MVKKAPIEEYFPIEKVNEIVMKKSKLCLKGQFQIKGERKMVEGAHSREMWATLRKANMDVWY